MSVDELNKKELNELRESYFEQLKDQTGNEVLQGISCAEELDMEIVKEYHRATYFVKEDFWCNI